MALLGVEPKRKKQLVDFKFGADKIKRQRVQRVVTKPRAPLAIADVSSGISSHDGEESQSSSSSSSESSSDVSVQSSSEHVDLSHFFLGCRIGTLDDGFGGELTSRRKG